MEKKIRKTSTGRPSIGDKAKVAILSVRLHPKHVDKLDRVAGRLCLQRADLLRWIVEDLDETWKPRFLEKK